MAFADTSERYVVYGYMPQRITLTAVAVRAGDPIGYSTGWKQADANASPAVTALLIAGEDGAASSTITAYRAAMVEGFTGATAGAALYISDTIGKYSDTVSTTTAQVVGYMASDTAAWISPQFNSTALTDTHILVGNGSGVAVDVAMSGDATIANTGAVTIAALAVDGAMLNAKQQKRYIRGDTQDIDTAAAALNEVILCPVTAITITKVRLVYEHATSGTCAAATFNLGTTATGTEICAATNLENSKTIGTYTDCTIVSGAVAANTMISATWTLLAATVAGKVHCEIEYSIVD